VTFRPSLNLNFCAYTSLGSRLIRLSNSARGTSGLWKWLKRTDFSDFYEFWALVPAPPIGKWGTKMKRILLTVLVLVIGGSAARSDELSASSRTGDTRFVAMSLSDGQGVRAVVSNVLAPTNGAHLTPCRVQVSFFNADGSLIGNVTTVQLKPGESASVPASHPLKLVRAVVSVVDVADAGKVCALRTSLEIFDAQTNTTFVMVPGEPNGSSSERSVSAAPAVGGAQKSISGRENSAAIATPPPSGGTVSPKPRSPVAAAAPPISPR
jgi:hypothetical protein